MVWYTSYFAVTTLSILLGSALDFFLGDPRQMPHVVVLMGRMISGMDSKLRKRCANRPKKLAAAGFLLVICMIAFWGLLPTALLYICWQVGPWLYLVVATLIVFQVLAARSLAQAGEKVTAGLAENLEVGRLEVSKVVGRDTSSMSQDDVIRATVETIAENTSDGVVAPLFYMLIFGPVGGLVYKAINTMDSMIGYKNDTYIDFGRPAARLDDVVNFLPARITAIASIGALELFQFDTEGAWRIFKRDRNKSTSPNAGQIEAVVAGGLGLRLLGPAIYFGVTYPKEYIGDNERPIEADDIKRTTNLMWVASGIFLLVGLIIRLIVAV